MDQLVAEFDRTLRPAGRRGQGLWRAGALAAILARRHEEQAMSGQRLYDTDFYTWTQQQAELLQQVRDNRIDTEHLAEEVADLGKRDLRAVRSYIWHLFRHLIKLAVSPADRPVAHWLSEADDFATFAREAFALGMRQHIDVEALWRSAVKRTNRHLARYGEPQAPTHVACPFDLDDLLSEDFDPDKALETVRRAIKSPDA
jgi:hypothetical protein